MIGCKLGKLGDEPRDKVDTYYRDLAIGCGGEKFSPALGTSIQDRDA